MNNAVIAVSVCLCGGLGAAARYVCDSVIKASWHKAFPLSTFVINSIAGFLAGVIAGLYSRHSYFVNIIIIKSYHLSGVII